MSTAQLKTPLFEIHQAHGARLVDFAGWSMPVQYEGIVAEHQATRQAVTLFDVSHMGRLSFTGPDAGLFLDRLSTRRIADMKSGRIRYSLMCRDDGGILDDVLIYRLSDEGGRDQFSMVVNASNRDKIVAWLRSQADPCEFVDRTVETAMIAVQGPAALAVARDWLGWDPADLPYYTGRVIQGAQGPMTVSRTGYTGEDGVELIVSADAGPGVWKSLMELGAARQIRPAGLGARDTLRLEAAMPLYGHELGESINAAQTGLGFAIQPKDREFVGRQAILAAQQQADLPVRIGLQLEGKRPAREGAQIYQEDRCVGEVTSGTFSPTLGTPIAMAYVRDAASQVGTTLEIDIRGSRHAATVVSLPFYKRNG